jgi:hypothetical protein
MSVVPPVKIVLEKVNNNPASVASVKEFSLIVFMHFANGDFRIIGKPPRASVIFA